MRSLLLFLIGAGVALAQLAVPSPPLTTPSRNPFPIVQATNCTTGSGAKTIACTLQNITAGNGIVASCGGGNWAASTWASAFSDTAGNNWQTFGVAHNSTTQVASVGWTTAFVGGADTISWTISGASSANSGMACRVYEVAGAVTNSGGDQFAVGNNAGSTTASATLSGAAFNTSVVFQAIATGASQASMIPGNGFVLDSGVLAPTGGGLVAFGSQFSVTTGMTQTGTIGTVTCSNTLASSAAWATQCINILVQPTLIQVTTPLPAGSNVIGGVTLSNGSVNVNQLAGTTTDTNSGNKSAGTLRVVIATDQPQLTNKLLVTPDANSAINVAQINGVTPLMGAGNTGTGSLRVTLATDQANLTTALNVNTAQINGVTPLMGNGTTGTGSLRVTLASDNTPNSNPFLFQPVPGTANGMSLYNVEPGASDNHANIKNGAGVFYHLQATNKGSANLYLRLYNAATGFNGCNSATNLVYSAIIPNGTANGAGIVDDYPMGITFSTGISICVSGAYGQTDTTSATASIGEINVAYK